MCERMINLKNECYTPAYFVDPIREFANGFDFDPFSCVLANQTIKAKHFLSIDQDGFDFIPWSGFWFDAKTIWCNPPYSTQDLKKAVELIIANRKGKEVYLLLNTDNSTANYKLCLHHCQAVMLVKDRIKFYRPYADFPSQQNNRSQSLFFFGSMNRAIEFKAELSHLGKVFIND